MLEVTAATKPDHAESVKEPPLLESIEETCRLTGLGRTKIYELFDSGELTRVKIGRRVLYHLPTLSAWFSARAAGGARTTNPAPTPAH